MFELIMYIYVRDLWLKYGYEVWILCEILARSKDIIHDVTTSVMSRTMLRLCDDTINQTIEMDKN
jgi:hypothetical protein